MTVPGTGVEDRWRRLDRYRRNDTSQNGEDGIIERLLEILPATPRVCLEVGAYDGKSMSNTYRLWHDLGWRALLIEASPSRFEQLKVNCQGFDNVVTLNTMIAPTGVSSLASLVRGCGMEPHIGVLSLDIDSNELEYVEHLDGLRVDIVVLEFNFDIPSDVCYRDLPQDVFFRHSAKAVEDVALRSGFRIVACVGPNAVLVREAAITPEAAGALPDLPVEAMFDYAFVRRKRSSHAVIRSKLVSEDLGFVGKPSSWNGLRLRPLSRLLRIRRLLIGGGTREPTNQARRDHMKKSGIWI